jgi:uncharacterized membrane protein
MKNKFSEVEKMIFFSVMFTMILLLARVALSRNGMYLFLAWNMFLAGVPLVISRTLVKQTAINVRALCLLLCWLIFFPNAPYIITDVFHLIQRPAVPKWFDLLILVSAAWNGLIMGVVSLMQLERFLLKHLKKITVNLFVFLSLITSAFGVYLGRFLRFNSWDVLTNRGSLLHEVLSRFINPLEHPRTWGFTVLFGSMLLIIHYTVKKLADIKYMD